MFADNQKISLRQIKRLLIMDVFGVGSLILPGILSSATGADGVFCLLLGMTGGLFMILLMWANLRNMRGDYYSYIKDNTGQFVGDIFMVFYYLYYITLCGFVLYQITTLVMKWLLPEGSYFWVSILLLLLAAYGTVRGIEGRARVYEIIFWFLGVPLFVMLLLALREVNTDYWMPLLASDGKELLRGSIAYWIFFLPFTSILFLKPFCQKEEKLTSCAVKSWICVTVLNIAVYLILLGVFGKNTMGVLKNPVITLMSMIDLPGGFFTRQDVVMMAVWFFALFALMNTCVFQSSLILKDLFRRREANAEHFSLIISLLIAFIIGLGMFENAFMTDVFEIYQRWIALPGMILILLVLLVVYRIKIRLKAGKGGVNTAETVKDSNGGQSAT